VTFFVIVMLLFCLACIILVGWEFGGFCHSISCWLDFGSCLSTRCHFPFDPWVQASATILVDTIHSKFAVSQKNTYSQGSSKRLAGKLKKYQCLMGKRHCAVVQRYECIGGSSSRNGVAAIVLYSL
jgi:hypothetical protein